MPPDVDAVRDGLLRRSGHRPASKPSCARPETPPHASHSHSFGHNRRRFAPTDFALTLKGRASRSARKPHPKARNCASTFLLRDGYQLNVVTRQLGHGQAKAHTTESATAATRGPINWTDPIAASFWEVNGEAKEQKANTA